MIHSSRHPASRDTPNDHSPATGHRLPDAALPRSFYHRETVLVARDLLGCVLHRRIGRRILSGVIVETEAYLGANDMASHARRGLRSPRNESMYLGGGHAYVYFTYGMYHCMNVVTQESGIAEAVLVRALEPIEGLDTMRRNRPVARRDIDLASGPGKLCMAFGIDRRLDGEPLDGNLLWLEPRRTRLADAEIGVSTRIGIGGAGEEASSWPLRFFVIGNRNVSRWRG